MYTLSVLYNRQKPCSHLPVYTIINPILEQYIPHGYIYIQLQQIIDITKHNIHWFYSLLTLVLFTIVSTEPLNLQY